MKLSPRVLFWVAALCVAACSAPVSTGAAGAGGATGQGGTAGSAAGAGGASALAGTLGTAGIGGGSGTAGHGAVGGTTGGAGTAGGAGTVGGATAAAGANGGGGTGEAGSGGRGGGGGGAAGSSVAGNGGARGGGGGSGGAGVDAGDASAADPRMAADVLDGFALLKPCFSTPGSCAGCTCDENPSNILNSGVAPENQHLSKQFGGDAGAVYNVKLRVVGVAERYWYAGGTLDSTSKVFYTGGLPTIHSAQAPNNNLGPGQGACKIHPPQTNGNYPIPFTVPPEVAPADGCYNGFNIFAMTVSLPKQSYFLNDTTDFDGVDRQPHAVYKTDYTVTISIAGQATIDFYVIDGDHHQVANTNMTVPNVKNTQIKQPYVGNFLELEVVDVALAPPR